LAPPQPEAPRGESLQTLIDRYAVDLKGEIAKRIEYPMVARQEGWQGKGEVLLQIGANGAIADIRVVRTSGYALLDRAVIDGVRQAHAEVPLFPELRGRAFPVSIPFELNLTAR
jgi:protein TonB